MWRLAASDDSIAEFDEANALNAAPWSLTWSLAIVLLMTSPGKMVQLPQPQRKFDNETAQNVLSAVNQHTLGSALR
jgi:hypothetical protein